jgi:hypothetical protein
MFGPLRKARIFPSAPGTESALSELSISGPAKSALTAALFTSLSPVSCVLMSAPSYSPRLAFALLPCLSAPADQEMLSLRRRQHVIPE